MSRGKILFRVTAPLVGVIAATAVAGAALEAFPEELLGEDLTARLYDPYNTTPLGIYFWSPEAQMNLMWPSLALRAYSHGHFWTHRTDARGFRNPPGRQATGVLLLGDSMIYGHGVEDAETVTGFLHAEHGHPAYNMARQGDCLFQHYRLLRLYLDETAPRTVFLFFFSNDVADLAGTGALGQGERSPEIDGYDWAGIRRSIESRARGRPPAPFASRFVLGRLLTVPERGPDADRGRKGAGRELAAAMLPDLRRKGVLPPEGTPIDAGHLKRFLGIPRLREVLAGGWSGVDEVALEAARAYQLRILGDLGRRCGERGARLVLVNLALDQGDFWRAQAREEAERKVRKSGFEATPGAKALLERFLYDARLRYAGQVGESVAAAARELGLEYLDLSRSFTAADNYLERDGHLNATGHRRLAGHLHRFLAGGERSEERVDVRRARLADHDERGDDQEHQDDRDQPPRLVVPRVPEELPQQRPDVPEHPHPVPPGRS